jgi:hypothetical protein
VGFLVIHIISEVIAGRAQAGDAVVPFAGHPRTLYLGLGTLAADLFVLILVTGIMRGRFAAIRPPWAWRALHAAAYLAWPLAILHGLLDGRTPKPCGLELRGMRGGRRARTHRAACGAPAGAGDGKLLCSGRAIVAAGGSRRGRAVAAGGSRRSGAVAAAGGSPRRRTAMAARGAGPRAGRPPCAARGLRRPAAAGDSRPAGARGARLPRAVRRWSCVPPARWLHGVLPRAG